MSGELACAWALPSDLQASDPQRGTGLNAHG